MPRKRRRVGRKKTRAPHRAPRTRPEGRGAKTIRATWEFERLDAQERLAYERALHALSLARRHPHWSLPRLAHEADTTTETILAYVGSAFRRDPAGVYRARPQDRLLRRMPIPTPRGVVHLDVTDSRTASTLGQYWNAIKQLQRGHRQPLQAFGGKTVRVGKITRPLLTDPITLRRILDADVVSPESIYRDTL